MTNRHTGSQQGYGGNPEFGPPEEVSNSYLPMAPPRAPRTGLSAGQWALVIGLVVMLGCFGLGALAVAMGPEPDPIQATETADPRELTNPPSTASTTMPIGPRTTFGEGTYEVGPEVAPGKYKSPGAKKSAFQLCTWTIKGVDGKVIDLGSANGEAEQQIVTLEAEQTFESSGCKDWSKA